MLIRNKCDVTIGEIEIGEVFIYSEIPYVKIDKGPVDVNTEFPCLVLNLKENKLNAFKNNVLVQTIKAEVIIG